MALIRPRLTDHYNVPLTQEAADFAIPFLDEDIPLCVDPFLLWKSPSQQENSLYIAVSSSFNHLGYLTNNGKENEAIEILLSQYRKAMQDFRHDHQITEPEDDLLESLKFGRTHRVWNLSDSPDEIAKDV